MALQLTDEQRAIVEHEGGHARVLAVAGSGKTFTMGHRIAHLVQNKRVNPKRIRVLMFNRLAREQFEERLLKLGFSKNGMPYVTTFHGFAFQFLSLLRNRGLLSFKEIWTGDEIEKARILLHEVIRELRNEGILPQKDAPDGEFDVEEVMDTIGQYKSSLISPKNAGHYFDERIPFIYQRFEQRRIEKQALTFDDFVPTVISFLENDETLRKQWASSVDYLIVDEYQDVNFGQQRLIEILAGDRAEIMVVGDDDQTIYEWRGARPNYIIRDFMTTFSNKPHSIYKLSYSFRFGPLIAQTAQNCIRHNTNRVEKELFAKNASIDNNLIIKRSTSENLIELHKEMTKEIIRLVKREYVKPTEIWVLGRMYAQLASLEIMLLAFKVPYQVLGGKPIFQRPEIKKIITYFKVGADINHKITKTRAKEFLEILNYPNRKLPRKKIETFLTQALAQGNTWAFLMDWFLSDEGEEMLDLYQD